MSDQDFIAPARPVIGDEEIDAAVRVLRSGMVVQGPEVAAFEEEFSALVDGRHCVAVNSGTSALHLSLVAIGIKPGDEVIVPSFSFAATANAVRLAGGEPVFVDIEPDYFSVDPAAVEAAIGPRTAAIMPVHLYGHPADMTALMAIADKHGLAVVEDAAQAHAASWQGHAGRRLRRRGLLQLLPDQEHALPRGRHDHHRGRDRGPQPPAAAQPGHGAAVRQRDRRRQHAAHRRGRRDRAGPARQARRVDRAAPRQRRRARAPGSRGSSRRRRPTAPGTSTTSTPSACPPASATRCSPASSERGIGSAVYYPTPIHQLKPYLPGFTDLAGQQPRTATGTCPSR